MTWALLYELCHKSFVTWALAHELCTVDFILRLLWALAHLSKATHFSRGPKWDVYIYYIIVTPLLWQTYVLEVFWGIFCSYSHCYIHKWFLLWVPIFCRTWVSSIFLISSYVEHMAPARCLTLTKALFFCCLGQARAL